MAGITDNHEANSDLPELLSDIELASEPQNGVTGDGLIATPLTLNRVSNSLSSLGGSSGQSEIEPTSLPPGQLSLPPLDALPPLEVPDESSFETADANRGSFQHPNLTAFGGISTSQRRSAHRRSSRQSAGTSSQSTSATPEGFAAHIHEAHGELARLKDIEEQIETQVADARIDRALSESVLVMNNTINQSYLSESGPSISNNLNQLQRPTSSSSHSAHGGQQHVNGSSQAAMSALNAVPTNAGSHLDLNYIMSKLNELSAQLAANRDQSSGIVQQVAEVRRRAAAEGTTVSLEQMNGDLNGPACDHEPIIFALRKENKFLLHEVVGFKTLATNYENAMTEVVSMVRDYVYNQTTKELGIHKHYHEQLTQERENTMNESLENERMREGLRNLNEYLRKAHFYGSIADANWIKKVAYWQHEAKQLRKIVYAESIAQGIDVVGEDDEDMLLTSDQLALVTKDEGPGQGGDDVEGKATTEDKEENAAEE
ncbi:MAG: hypothetical protein M1835_001214 [Candelina submexicana]|nr:MAG: hypothetical protein M1835_001214 [Candelina submexicana]